MQTFLVVTFAIAGLRIAIALVWTIAAFVAAAIHYVNFREAQKNQHAVRNSGPLGVEVAHMIVRLEQDRFLKMIILASVGVGALLGSQLAGWGLLALPIIGVLGSIADRKSRARQKEIVEAGVSKHLVAPKVTVEPGPDGTVIAKPDNGLTHLPDGTEVPPEPPTPGE